MDPNFFRYEVKRNLPSVAQVLLVFLTLVVIFGTLSSHQPDVWDRFQPRLLMGLSYAMISLSFGQLFQEDFEDGTLELMMSDGRSLEGYCLAKVIIHWVRLGIPLAFLCAIVSGFGSMPLMMGVAFVTLTLTFLGAMASSLCLATKSSSLLLPVLTLPLGIPILLVSMGSITDTTADASSYLTLQGGLFCMSMAISLLATPFALRLSLRYH